MFWSNILGPKNILENISDRKKKKFFLKTFWANIFLAKLICQTVQRIFGG
jgi:hypothetical protein